MKKIISLILVIVMAAALIGCGGAGGGKLTIATSPDFPPFEYLEGGKVVGIEIEILEKVAAKLGKELVVEQMDFDSVIPGVQAGKFNVGVSGITVTEERKQNMDFSDVYFMASQAIVVMPDSPITCKADLEGKKISVQTGTTAEVYCMENGYEVSAFSANNDAASALTIGKVDAWVVDNEVAVVLAEQMGLTVLDEAMTAEPYAFAFKKGTDAEMVAAFNAVIAEMIADGSMQALFDKYGAVYVSP